MICHRHLADRLSFIDLTAISLLLLLVGYRIKSTGMLAHPKASFGPALELSRPPRPRVFCNKLPTIISAKQTGNVARFMNHSCSPNVFYQPVMYDHGDEGYPHIAFFAIKNIPPMTELTYDYGQSNGSGCRRPKICICQSHMCKGTFG